LNNLEKSILTEIAKVYPELTAHIPALKVKSREITGVGMYVNFEYSGDPNFLPRINHGMLSVNKTVHLDNLKYGLGCVLDILNGKVNFIELFTYDESWDGTYKTFYWGELYL
jgi:hypothetical protein